MYIRAALSMRPIVGGQSVCVEESVGVGEAR